MTEKIKKKVAPMETQFFFQQKIHKAEDTVPPHTHLKHWDIKKINIMKFLNLSNENF